MRATEKHSIFSVIAFFPFHTGGRTRCQQQNCVIFLFSNKIKIEMVATQFSFVFFVCKVLLQIIRPLAMACVPRSIDTVEDTNIAKWIFRDYKENPLRRGKFSVSVIVNINGIERVFRMQFPLISTTLGSNFGFEWIIIIRTFADSWILSTIMLQFCRSYPTLSTWCWHNDTLLCLKSFVAFKCVVCVCVCRDCDTFDWAVCMQQLHSEQCKK